MKLKNNIGLYIKRSGYKKKWVAEQIEINPNTLSRWIVGRGMPSVVSAFKLAKLLNCKVDDLFFEDNE